MTGWKPVPPCREWAGWPASVRRRARSDAPYLVRLAVPGDPAVAGRPTETRHFHPWWRTEVHGDSMRQNRKTHKNQGSPLGRMADGFFGPGGGWAQLGAASERSAGRATAGPAWDVQAIRTVAIAGTLARRTGGGKPVGDRRSGGSVKHATLSTTAGPAPGAGMARFGLPAPFFAVLPPHISCANDNQRGVIGKIRRDTGGDWRKIIFDNSRCRRGRSGRDTAG
jgi:hypothetical protein